MLFLTHAARTDTVRMRPGVTPAHGWGSVTRSSVGTLTAVADGTVIVGFPEDTTWMGKLRELEAASPQLKCPKGHALAIVEHGEERPRPYRGAKYSCDVCGRTPEPPLPRMHCNICKFDMCDTCAQRTAVFAGHTGKRLPRALASWH